jgi:hypothetical protein
MDDTPLTRAKAGMEGRRRAIASDLRQILDNPKGLPYPIGYLTALYGLVHQTVTAHSQLWDAAAEKNVMYCAYNTRNLLELGIWSEYCCRSVEHGLRFAEDTVRDYAGILVAIRDVATGLDDQKSRTDLAELLANHAVRSTALGMGAEDRGYLRINAAAKELGPEVEQSFKAVNTVVSKFVHPTAFVVNNAAFPQWDDAFVKEVVLQMFAIGISRADAIIERISAKVVGMKTEAV